MATERVTILIQARNFANRELGRLENKVDSLSRRFRHLAQIAAAAAGAAVTAVGVRSVRAAAEMERLELAMAAVTGSASQAEVEIRRLKETARLPGLGFQEAIQGSVRLQAAGASADEAKEALEAFGNAIALAGGGKAELDRVTLALQQILAAGRLMGQDLRQIQQVVPQIQQALIAAFGTANTERLQKMGVTAEEFFAKITDALGELPKLTGGLANSFENFQDTIFQLSAAFGETLAPSVADYLEQISAAGEVTLETRVVLEQIGGSIRIFAQELVFVARAVFNTITSALSVAMAAIAEAIGTTEVAIGGLLSLIPGLGDLGERISQEGNRWRQAASNQFQAAMNDAKDTEKAWENLGNTIIDVTRRIEEARLRAARGFDAPEPGGGGPPGPFPRPGGGGDGGDGPFNPLGIGGAVTDFLGGGEIERQPSLLKDADRAGVAIFQGVREGFILSAKQSQSEIKERTEEALTDPTRRSVNRFKQNMKASLANAGTQLVMGLVSGMKDATDVLKNFIINILGALVNHAFKLALGIASPSKLTRGIGRNLGLGLQLGMEDSISGIQRAAMRMSSAAMPEVRGIGNLAAAGASGAIGAGLTVQLPEATNGVQQLVNDVVGQSIRELRHSGVRLDE